MENKRKRKKKKKKKKRSRIYRGLLKWRERVGEVKNELHSS